MSRPIPVSRVFACLTVLAACAHAGAAEPDWRGYTSEQQQRSVLAVEQDAEAINKRYYDSAFEEFLPELEQLELSLAQPVVAVDDGFSKTHDFLKSLGSDKYGGELLPTIVSFRELVESFNKKSGALISDTRKMLGDLSASINKSNPPPRR